VITLTHVDDTRLYQAEHSTDPGFLTYYVSDQEVEKKDLPPTITVDTEWWSKSTLRGYFLILPNEPADIRAFAAVTDEYPFGVPGHASFAWVQYQENPAKINNVYKLDLNQDEGGELLITTGAMFRFSTIISFLSWLMRASERVLLFRITSSSTCSMRSPSFSITKK